MKKTMAFILTLILVLGTFSACGEKKTNTAQSNKTAESTEATEASYKEKELKVDNIKKLNIKYSGVANYIYTKDGVDFCSAYSEKENFCTISENGVKVLSDQKCGENFFILDNKIYYTVIDGSKEYKNKNGEAFTFDNQSCWVMNIDGSEKTKLFDFDDVNGYPVYFHEEDVFYMTNNHLDDAINDYEGTFIGIGNFYRYNLKEKKSYIIYKDVDYDITYANGFLFFHGFATYFADCQLSRYNVAENKLEDLNYISTSVFAMGEDTLYMNDYTGCEDVGVPKFVKYSVSKNTGEYVDMDSSLEFYQYLDDGTVILSGSESDLITYYSFNEKEGLKKLNYFEDEESNIEINYFENADSCYYGFASQNGDNCIYNICNQTNGKNKLIIKSDEYKNAYECDTNTDGNPYMIVALGRHTAVVFEGISKEDSNYFKHNTYTFTF